MSLDRIYKILTVDAQWDDLNPQPPQSVLIATDATNSAYLVGEGGFTDWDALTSTIVGSWDSATGAPIGTPTVDYGTWIAEWGNSAGVATAVNDTTRWQGHSEAKLFVYDDTDPQDIIEERYPVTERPFTIKMTQEAIGVGALPWDNVTQYFTGDYVTNIGSTWIAINDNLNSQPFGGSPDWALEGSPGWGWKAELISDNPTVDVVARAIGIYSDPAWTSYLYTSGAFSLDPQTGLYTSLCPPGQRTATADPIYYSVLLGSAQEGNWQLISPDDGYFEDRFHWKFDA